MEILRDKARPRTKARQIESSRSVVCHAKSDRSVGPRIARRNENPLFRYGGLQTPPRVVPHVVVNVDPLSSHYGTGRALNKYEKSSILLLRNYTGYFRPIAQKSDF